MGYNNIPNPNVNIKTNPTFINFVFMLPPIIKRESLILPLIFLHYYTLLVVLIYKKAATPIIANPPKVNITVPTPPVTGNVNLLFATTILLLSKCDVAFTVTSNGFFNKLYCFFITSPLFPVTVYVGATVSTI